MLQFEAPKENSNYIKVVGVGGGGTNAINHMYNKGISGVDFIVCNTDKKSLDASPVENKIKIGKDGLGAGNNPEKAKVAALAAEDEIKAMLGNNTQMLFIAAGMGGGTGTGAAPVVAQFAKEIEIKDDQDQATDDKILVVAVVTLPLSFEGARRKKQAEEGIKNLKSIVDAIIIVNTDKIGSRAKVPMTQMFPMADDILLTATKGIAEIITTTGYVMADFRDVQSIMANSGVAIMGIGTGFNESEEGRAITAIKQAAQSDLLNDSSLKGTKNVLLYITCSPEDDFALTTEELDEITTYLRNEMGGEPDVIWGLKYDDSYKDQIDITMIATGFEEKELFNPFDRTTVNTVTLDEKLTTSQEEKPVAVKVENDYDPNKQIKVTPIEDEKPRAPFIAKKVTIEPKVQNPQPIQPIQNEIKHHTLNVFPDSNRTAESIKPQTQAKPILTEEAIMTQISVKEEPIVAKQTVDSQQPMSKPTITPDFVAPRTDDSQSLFKDKTHEQVVQERQKRMEQFAKQMHTDRGLESLINTPAYKLYNEEIDELQVHSAQKEASAYILVNGKMIKDDNSFLNDNPD